MSSFPIETNGGVILSVSGPKGGVGRTVISCLLADNISRGGKKCLLVDGDIGLGKIFNKYGLESKYFIEDYLLKDVPFSKLINKVSKNLDFISSAHGNPMSASLPPSELEGFMLRLDQLRNNYDYIIYDSAPGIHSQQLEILKYADLSLLIINPEISSLLDALAYLKIITAISLNRNTGVIVNNSHSFKEAQASYAQLLQMSLKCGIHRPVYLGQVEYDKSLASRDIVTWNLMGSNLSGPNRDNINRISKLINLSDRAWAYDGHEEQLSRQ